LKDFAATIQLYNNNLFQRRKEAKLSQVDMARLTGINQSLYSKFERMERSPLTTTGDGWTTVARKLADFWGTSCEELFPEVILKIKQSYAHVKFDAGDLLLSEGTLGLIGAPDDACAEKELRKAANAAFWDRLDAYERFLLMRRYGLGDSEPMPTAELAALYGVTPQAIEEKRRNALKKLRKAVGARRIFDEGIHATG
jgi:transcriptional regulator with XRE-family HTH domain